MARLSGRFRKFRRISWPTAMTTNTVGTVSFPGPRMHRTPSGKPPRDSHRCTAYSATNPLCSPGWKNLLTFQLWTTSSGRVRESGTQPISTSSRQCGETRPLQMPAGLTSIAQEINSGSRTGICIPAIS